MRNLILAFSIYGESPPPPPGVFYGRDEWIEKIIGFVEHLASVALIGPGGIGKTSIALTVLHDDRIKQRFGDDRRFIRCDVFSTSLANFLSRLSKVIGAGIENPDDLTPLRRFLSSKEMVIVLDNAESILDPQGVDAQGIYAVVEELSRFSNICLCITSRITTIPSDCEALEIPTLSTEAAHDMFYRIYKHGERSDLVSHILEKLDFHPLSINLLATVAHHSKWDTGRLAGEWERRRTAVLHTKHSKSLAATIELSLTSPTFQELGPDARDLLGIVAFFPQGINESNLDWLFPTTPDKTNIFDTFCILSLTYRSNGIITMLAPLRDHFYPDDPRSSPLLCTTKERYFCRLSLVLDSGEFCLDEAQWITSEDVNVEHLLDIFTSIDANSDEVWSACYHFILHLLSYKTRPVTLGPKIEGLPDDHPLKFDCLSSLSRLLANAGKCMESKRLLGHIFKLGRDRGDGLQVAEALMHMSDVNRMLGLYEEGIQQAKEALETFGRLNHISGQSGSLCRLAYLLQDDGQLDAAEGAAWQAIIHFSGESDACGCHRLLGDVYCLKGETEKALNHFKTALEIASSLNSHYHLFWTHYLLAELAFGEARLDDAHTHIECAKSYAVNDAYITKTVFVQSDEVRESVKS
jgi:tetratricopeptide (TPR) repeat protein